MILAVWLRENKPETKTKFRSHLSSALDSSRRPFHIHETVPRTVVGVNRGTACSRLVIDIDEFVPKKEIDELYLNSPYYIAPDGEVGQQAFAVIREAIRKEGMVAIGKIVFTSREHIIALEARGMGLLGVLLRYPYEVRAENEYFDDIPDEKIPKDMLDLASHIVKTKEAHFDPNKFDDRYEDALKDLLKKKQEGKPIERPERREPAKVINLMDALRRSVEASGAQAAVKSKGRQPSSRRQPEQTKRKKAKRAS